MSENINHLVLGSEDAELEIESYINLGCPFCALYINSVDEVFEEYIEAGKVKHIIKHVDRTKGPLLKGAVANTYLDTTTPEETYKNIKKLVDTREEWSSSFDETLKKVEDELNLTEQNDAGERSVEILNEVAEREVKVVPTVFINGDKFNFSVKGESEEIEKEFLGKLENG